jgi:hypothetical protein
LVKVVKHKGRGKENRSEVAELRDNAILLETWSVVVDYVKERRRMTKIVNACAAVESNL